MAASANLIQEDKINPYDPPSFGSSGKKKKEKKGRLDDQADANVQMLRNTEIIEPSIGGSGYQALPRSYSDEFGPSDNNVGIHNKMKLKKMRGKKGIGQTPGGDDKDCVIF